VFIDVVGDRPVHAGMTFGSAGPLLGAVGDLLGLTPPEGGRLAGGGAGLFVELLLELTRRVSEDAASDCLAYACC